MPVEYYLCSGSDPSLSANRFSCPPRPFLLIVAIVLVVLGILVAWEKIKNQRTLHSQLNVGCTTAVAVAPIGLRRGRLVTDIGLCLLQVSYGLVVIASRQLYHHSDPVSMTVTPRFLIVLLHHFFLMPTGLAVLVGFRLWSDQELKHHLKRHFTSSLP